MARPKGFAGIPDSRSMRGILSRGHAKYVGPSNSPRPGSIFNIQKAAQKRLKKFQDMRRTGR